MFLNFIFCSFLKSACWDPETRIGLSGSVHKDLEIFFSMNKPTDKLIQVGKNLSWMLRCFNKRKSCASKSIKKYFLGKISKRATFPKIESSLFLGFFLAFSLAFFLAFFPFFLLFLFFSFFSFFAFFCFFSFFLVFLLFFLLFFAFFLFSLFFPFFFLFFLLFLKNFLENAMFAYLLHTGGKNLEREYNMHFCGTNPKRPHVKKPNFHEGEVDCLARKSF